MLSSSCTWNSMLLLFFFLIKTLWCWYFPFFLLYPKNRHVISRKIQQGLFSFSSCSSILFLSCSTQHTHQANHVIQISRTRKFYSEREGAKEKEGKESYFLSGKWEQRSTIIIMYTTTDNNHYCMISLEFHVFLTFISPLLAGVTGQQRNR